MREVIVMPMSILIHSNEIGGFGCGPLIEQEDRKSVIKAKRW